jgi:nucleotide-binding universal stress UspA family protein
MVRRMIKADELARMEAEWSEAAIAPARAILDQAGVRHQGHAIQGEVAQSVARLAEELGCDQIVMGTRGLSTLGDLLMGSVATKVLHLATVPVTFVK